MRPPDHRPSARYSSAERPPPGVVTLASVVGVALLVLLSLSPLLVGAALFAATVSAVAARECGDRSARR